MMLGQSHWVKICLHLCLPGSIPKFETLTNLQNRLSAHQLHISMLSRSMIRLGQMPRKIGMPARKSVMPGKKIGMSRKIARELEKLFELEKLKYVLLVHFSGF